MNLIEIFKNETGMGFTIQPELYKDDKTIRKAMDYLINILEEIEIKCTKD